MDPFLERGSVMVGPFLLQSAGRGRQNFFSTSGQIGAEILLTKRGIIKNGFLLIRKVFAYKERVHSHEERCCSFITRNYVDFLKVYFMCFWQKIVW